MSDKGKPMTQKRDALMYPKVGDVVRPVMKAGFPGDALCVTCQAVCGNLIGFTTGNMQGVPSWITREQWCKAGSGWVVGYEVIHAAE